MTFTIIHYPSTMNLNSIQSPKQTKNKSQQIMTIHNNSVLSQFFVFGFILFLTSTVPQNKF